jgi:putative addiction module component (TIGR02574 family)
VDRDAQVTGPHGTESRGSGENRFGQGYNPIHDAKAQELLKKALALPERERADLAGSLIESLDQTVDENAEAAWQEEIARRLEEVRSGKAKTTPWNDVRRKGRTLLHK